MPDSRVAEGCVGYVRAVIGPLACLLDCFTSVLWRKWPSGPANVEPETAESLSDENGGNSGTGVHAGERMCTEMLNVVQKLFELLLPGEEPDRGAGKSILPSDLMLEISRIGGRDVFRMADKQGEDGRLRGDLGYKGRLRDLGGLAFSNGQGVGRQNLLQELVEVSGGDSF